MSEDSLGLSKEQIQKIHARAEKLGGWNKYGVKSQICREAPQIIGRKLSRPTLDKMRKLFPTAPEREPRKVALQPSYIEQFEQSEAVTKFREANKPPKIVASTLARYISVGRETWRFLGKKDPSTWTEEDFAKAKDNPAFIDRLMGTISFNNKQSLRAWIMFLGYYELVKRPEWTTKGFKREKGRRKADYIKSEDEMIRVIQAIETPDTLLFMRVGIESGGRHSSTSIVEPQNIDYAQGLIYMYEKKIKKGVERIISRECLAQLRQYIIDFNIQPSEKLFKKRIGQVNRELKEAGNKAQLGINFTSHALKHTFVSLASAHGVSLEVVSDQAHTDAKTLQEFYLAINPAKKRHELLGEPYNMKLWGDLIKDLDPYYRQRYNEIKGHFHKIDGIALVKTTTPKPAKVSEGKRPIQWSAYDARIKKYNSLTAQQKAEADKSWGRTIPTAIKALALHNQGLSDAEVRAKMGWAA